MPLHDFLQSDGLLFAAAHAFQRAFGKVQVLELFQMLETGLADIVGFAAPSAAGQPLQAFFDRRRKSYGQHMPPHYTSLAIQV